ncbi:hypothetical protein BKA80DRAFT_263237 [Phyllosticta citrichinensis]
MMKLKLVSEFQTKPTASCTWCSGDQSHEPSGSSSRVEAEDGDGKLAPPSATLLLQNQITTHSILHLSITAFTIPDTDRRARRAYRMTWLTRQSMPSVHWNAPGDVNSFRFSSSSSFLISPLMRRQMPPESVLLCFLFSFLLLIFCITLV